MQFGFNWTRYFLEMVDCCLSLVMRKPVFAYAKTKTQISFAVTAKLISAFVFATRIVQSLFFLDPKFQASSHFLWLYSLVCVRPGRKPRRAVFSQRGSFVYKCLFDLLLYIHIKQLRLFCPTTTFLGRLNLSQ